ncbi:unnamed protein product [Closterium sp. Yama58-4]|nr:unnamed protein product [Closterium sp. Yama58-4]
MADMSSLTASFWSVVDGIGTVTLAWTLALLVAATYISMQYSRDKQRDALASATPLEEMPLERLTDTGRHDARVDQSSAAEQTSDGACIGGGGKEEYDALVVGAGIAGCALAYSLGKTGRRVLVLERDLSEPDRIVGELLQPGGYLKLVELGMQDCVDGIDAQRVDGYALFMDGGDCKVSYPTLSTAQLHMLFAGHRLEAPGSAAGDEMWKVAGRGFHNGRFVQRLREKAASLPTVTLREATVLGLLEDGDRVTGVRYRAAKRAPGSAPGSVQEASVVGGKGETEEGEMLAPLTFVCDGCFSNLRRSISKSKVDVPSSFVGLLLRDCALPHPNYGHVVLADPSPVLFYPVSSTEVRCLVDIPAGTKVPSIASGDMADYLLSNVLPQLPKQLQGPFREAVRAGDIRCMPNRIMPAVPVTRPGALLMGDAFNMRHPLTGGGMTVALSDVSVLTQILRPLKDFRNTRAVCEYAEAFYTRRKPIAATINTLSIALYRVFCASKDEAMMAMRQACFDYLQLGGACSEGPISLLSGLNPQPLSLVLHFFAVAFFALARLLLPLPKPGRVWLGARLIQGAVQLIVPIIKAEGFEAYEAANYRMWARSKSVAFSRRKASGSRSNEQHNLDFLDSYGYAPQNAELMTRVEENSSFSQVAERDAEEQGCGGDGDLGGDHAERGAAERLTEEGRAGGEGSKTRGARDSSGNSSSTSSHESAADEERGLRGFLRYCRKKIRQASTRADESCSDCADGADGEDAEGGEGKATAAGALLKRSLTEDTTGKTMARGDFNGLPRSASDVLQDAEMDEMDREVLQEAFVRVVALQQRVQHYRDLGGFVVLMALFITILYLQADSSRSYQITAAHSVLFPPGMRQDASNTFNGPEDFYSWLNTSIVQSHWADPTCGDGTCDRPFQFPAFGRFGCEADCGTFPNLTSIVVRFSSHLDTQQAADESSWNLCMVDPISLCWYESFQPFPRGDVEVAVPLDIPDGDWVVVLNAPAGGIRGTVHAPPPGTQRLSVVGAASTIELAAWGSCALEDDVALANQMLLSGGAAGAPPDMCRDVSMPYATAAPYATTTCARLVACLPTTCGRPFTEREVAGAFVDCARMCIVARASITTYTDVTCPMPEIASLFANTACNVSGATDQQRLRVLQVAVSRALFTMAKDRCLAGHGPGSKRSHTLGGPGSVRWHVVATLCTMLGGPVTTMDECRMYGADGKQVMTMAEMFAYLKFRHSGHVISAQHMVRWVQMVAAAVSSVTPVPDVAAARLNALLHSFDDAVVSSDAVGCSQGGAWLPWRAGVTHNTTVHVGDKVTWVWDDDLPHSLKVAGMGEVDDPLFLGFGGHRLAVSRKLACTPLNVGNGDAFDEPMPCVLKIDDGSAGSFAYSKVFEEPITIHYEDGTLSLDDSSPSSSSSTSAASLLTVLPARAGAEVAGVVNVTDSTTLSSTARFTPTNTITPSASSSSSSSAPYECAPGCLLWRLANGVCDAACNMPACAFDGGDCACVDPLFGPGICPCPPGHTRRDDGSCCLSTAVGANLNFPFSLQRYGPNYTESNYAFAAERGRAVNRFVSRRNRLLIGMVLQQDRWGTKQCNGSGLLHLAGWCSNGTSREPFGVNPHFLPTSAIYDSAATANITQLDNNTFGVKLRFNPQGLPYGFIYPMDSLTTLPLVFDINLDYEAAMRRLQYLVDGSYIDNGTRTVDVSFITFNGDSLTFVLTTVRCTVNAGGSMAVSFKSQPAAMAMYDASAENIARLVLEVVYLVGLLWNVCGELQEMADRAAVHGSVLSYFGLFWNWVDMLSLALQVVAVVLWVTLWRYVSGFDMQPRYDIYYSLLEMPRYWAVPNPPTGFLSATQAFADLRNIINLRAVYFALQGINVFFMMIRLLKVMDFQPYLGVITRSLALATPSLLHFFLLSFAVFFCFSMYGYLVFGGAMELFSTVPESMFSLFLLLINDNGSAYFLQRLESWDLIAAMLFFFMFIVFMVFILLNFLIAIIVDAFMSVKDSHIVATSIAADLAHIIKYKWNCWRGRYLKYSFILERLVQLGAKDTRVDQSDHRMRRMQSMQQRTAAMFCGSCGNTQPEASTSESWERRQHVLTVREKRIDAISLAMILQRRHDRERGEPHKAQPPYKCWPRAGSNAGAEDEEGLEQLSQAVVRQCGEVVKQAALPVKKPVQKLSLAHIKEDLARSEAAVKELRSMLALVLDHLARTHPLDNADHAVGAPAGPSAAPSMRRVYTAPLPLHNLLAESPQSLELAGSRREVPRRFSDAGPGGGAVEGEERRGDVRDGSSIAGGSASRSLLASKRGSERRVSFKDGTSDDRNSPLRPGEEWLQHPPV